MSCFCVLLRNDLSSFVNSPRCQLCWYMSIGMYETALVCVEAHIAMLNLTVVWLRGCLLWKLFTRAKRGKVIFLKVYQTDWCLSLEASSNASSAAPEIHLSSPAPTSLVPLSLWLAEHLWKEDAISPSDEPLSWLVFSLSHSSSKETHLRSISDAFHSIDFSLSAGSVAWAVLCCGTDNHYVLRIMLHLLFSFGTCNWQRLVTYISHCPSAQSNPALG